MAHQTTDLVSGAPLLIVDEATTTTIPHTETPIEILHMTATQLMITHTDLEGMKGTDMIDGIPTLVLDHLSAMYKVTAHHQETTRRVDVLLNAVRTDAPLIAVQVLDTYVFTLLLTTTR